MKRVAVHGSYFGYNFGDTLLCRLFSDWTKQGGASVVTPLASPRNQEIIGADHRGLLAASSAHGLLLCGGGYFSEPHDGIPAWSRRAYVRHLWLAEQAIARGRPTAILGVGVGPLTQPWVRKRVKRIFDAASVVVVRDQESLNCLTELDVTRPVTVAMDAAIGVTARSLGLDGQEPSQAILRARAAAPKVLVVHTNAFPTEQELSVVRGALEWLETQPDVAIILTTDSVGRRRPITWPDQLKRDFASLGERVQIALYGGRPEDLAGLLYKVDGIVTTKLHVGIVGTALERPVIALPKHSKTPRFYRQVGLDNSLVALDDRWREVLHEKLSNWKKDPSVDFSKMRQVKTQFSYESAVADFVKSLG